MTTNEHDTDPSTPSARRSPEGRPAAPFGDTDPVPIRTPTPPKPTTDPGLGPGHVGLGVGSPPVGPGAASTPGDQGAGSAQVGHGAGSTPGPAARPTQPMGIVVPAATPADVNKDSVELLLDGITGPQPERTRTKPQTDGEASAAYHARHDVRAARTSPDDEPKVVIERVAQPPTIRIDRSTIRQVEEAISRAALEPTAVVPPQTGPRVVVAVLAGLVVVLVLFVALRASSKRMGGHAVTSPVNVSASSATTTDPRLLTVPPPPAIASASAGANLGEAEPTSASAESTPAASADLVSGAAGLAPRPRSPAGPASSGAPKPRTKAAPSASAPKDLGELKTSFH